METETYDLTEAARRSGVSAEELRDYVDLGILTPEAGDRFSPRHLRRAGVVKALTDAGLPLEGLATAINAGRVSLDFIDAEAFDRFSTLGGETFAEVAERTGLPIEDLLFIREAAGAAAAGPEDRVRDAELVFVEWLEVARRAGIRPAASRHLFRVQGDGLRRVAESEAALWQSEVIGPATAAGHRPDEILGSDLGDRMSALSEGSVIGMYHIQQTRAWTNNIIEGLESQLAAAGLHSRLEHPPAMCFLDITGYTRVTEELGDTAAAELAEELGRIVLRTSVPFGGKPVKWLGDGVMLHFPNPGRGVLAALEMVVEVEAGGLPPAHVGLHAGPVIFQEGDYYGRTVNLASRIADYAKAGEVMVSQATVDACVDAPVAFRDVGPVALKNVAEPMRLFAASRAG